PGDPVQGEAPGLLVDPRHLPGVDGEGLPVDDGPPVPPVGEVVDVELRGAEALEVYVPGDDVGAGGVRPHRPPVHREEGEQERQDELLAARVEEGLFHVVTGYGNR